MKNLIISIIFLLSSNFIFCQTLEHDYNYLTNGLKIQETNGLGFKKGYELREVLNDVILGYNVFVRSFHRAGHKEHLGISVRLESKGNTMYFCVPSEKSNSEIWEKFQKSVTNKTYTNVLLLACAKACVMYSKQDLITANDEYNYITKGYKFQKENGLNMKENYMFNSIFDHDYKYCYIMVAELRKNSKTCGIMVEMVKGKDKIYLCVPFTDKSNSKLLKDFEGEVNKIFNTNFITFAVGRSLAALSNNTPQ